MFKEGIGFSPKTPLGIAPVYVKEHLAVKTSYKDTLKNASMWGVSKAAIVDSFIRHNSDNYKLAPFIGRFKNDKTKMVLIDYNKKQMTISNREEGELNLPIYIKDY